MVEKNFCYLKKKLFIFIFNIPFQFIRRKTQCYFMNKEEFIKRYGEAAYKEKLEMHRSTKGINKSKQYTIVYYYVDNTDITIDNFLDRELKYKTFEKVYNE